MTNCKWLPVVQNVSKILFGILQDHISKEFVGTLHNPRSPNSGAIQKKGILCIETYIQAKCTIY